MNKPDEAHDEKSIPGPGSVRMGRPTISAGKLHSWDTPTIRSVRPSEQMISVALGSNDAMRVGTRQLLQRRTDSCQFCYLRERPP